jgi:hypothetical protein
LVSEALHGGGPAVLCGVSVYQARVGF